MHLLQGGYDMVLSVQIYFQRQIINVKFKIIDKILQQDMYEPVINEMLFVVFFIRGSDTGDEDDKGYE